MPDTKRRPRLRFAPSPTGYLHVGGARTALFNWLYAKKYGGQFLLRIEDTDKARSTDESSRAIFEGLDWLGLRWDEEVVHRSDGTPIYNMAVVSDDIAMGITVVMRGDDHISNTPKQILLYRALGAELPVFAHLPMIHGLDGKKLSKRHGATAVGDYQHHGLLPQAMVNFLALLGWSPGGDREVMTLEEMTKL